MTKLFQNETDSDNDQQASENDDFVYKIGNNHNLRPKKLAVVNRWQDVTNSASRGTTSKLEQTADHKKHQLKK